MGDSTTANEKKVLKNLNPSDDFSTTDYAVAYNLSIQIAISFEMIVLFMIFRRKAPWLYFPNIKNRPDHPGYESASSFLGWIRPIVTIEDTKLVSLIGLDGFMLLQTICLMYRVCLIFSLTIAPFLIFWYFKKSKNVTLLISESSPSDSKTVDVLQQFFFKITIWGKKDITTHCIIIAFTYIISLFIFYLIFIYYKRFDTLRQLYLTSPATMTSITKLKHLATMTHSNQSSLETINVATRTCLMERLPKQFKTDEGIKLYVESLGIGEIESVAIVKDTYTLQKLYEERAEVIQDIEKEINATFLRMEEYYKKNKKSRESFGETYGRSLEEAANTLFSHSKFSIDEKIEMANKFLESNSKFITKLGTSSTQLRYHVNKLKEINDKIAEQKSILAAVPEDKEAVLEFIDNNESMFVRTDYKKDLSFFTFEQIFNFSEHRRLFTLDIPFERNKAFVTFKEQKNAKILQQAKIGTRVFSCTATQAPCPQDVIWKNITKGEVSTFFARIISAFAFVIFNAVFMLLVSKISEMLMLAKDSDNTIIRKIMANSTVRSLYTGSLVPLVYNLLLFFVPIIITMLLNMEGINSYSKFQIRLMFLLSLFLFFNAFISSIFVSSFWTVIKSLYAKETTVDQILSYLSFNFMKYNVFFFNTIIQRLCVGTAMVFMKPFPFIFNFIISPFLTKTRRQKEEIQFSPPIDFGIVIPNLLLLFPMVIVYSCISPIVLFAGFLFFFVNYFAYKNELFYATRNEFESGGIYWKNSARFIIYSVAAFQIVTAVNIYTSGDTKTTLMILPLLYFTYLFSKGINDLFVKSLNYLALNKPEEEFLDKFSRNVLSERKKLMDQWREIEKEPDEDVIPVSEIRDQSEEPKPDESFYKDPSVGSNISNIILPSSFYVILQYIHSFDSQNVFELKDK